MCFLSFPDSNSNPSGDIIFSFRLRRSRSSQTETNASEETSEQVSPALTGVVFFRQIKGDSFARGYLQKSLAILSDKPYISLLKKIAAVVGPLFFEHGTPLLEAAYQNITSWPDPQPGRVFDLPLLGTLLGFHVPAIGSPENRRRAVAVPKDQQPALYSLFYGVVESLWTLWEIVLTGEPLLVLSPDPVQCSDAVWALTSLIAPLTYYGDFRPYFTIHDSDFKEFTASIEDGAAPGAVIIGATNPFFHKVLGHWPHILTVGRPPAARRVRTYSGGKRLSHSTSKLVTDFRQELSTTVKKPLLSRDKAVLKQLLQYAAQCKKDYAKPGASSQDAADWLLALPAAVAVNNELLRKHFVLRTERFMVPLERYFGSLMPPAKDITPFRRPRLKPFSPNDFMAQLMASMQGKGSLLPSSSIPTKPTKAASERDATLQMELLYKHAVYEADIPRLLHGRSDVEKVDLFMTMREMLSQETHVGLRARLKEHLNAIISTLGAELQQSLTTQPLGTLDGHRTALHYGELATDADTGTNSSSGGEQTPLSGE